MPGSLLRRLWRAKSSAMSCIVTAIIVAAVLQVARPSVAADEEAGSDTGQLTAVECIERVSAKFKDSSAFSLSCPTPSDCEIAGKDIRNASAMAYIDTQSKGLAACWRASGLTNVNEQPSPPELKIMVEVFSAPTGAIETVCKMAHNKPFGQDRPTVAFRAACKSK